ncbi:M48 family metallopeptidase [Streptomyces sp. NPDC059928]|uniref:M48 family metallopeptidase n=1 Tax=unclassified Streptomyces TaxID=2593676 RepID=UPI003669485C
MVLLSVLVGVDWVATDWGLHGLAALKLYVVTAMLAVPIARGMLMLRSRGDDGYPGLLVDERQEPRLWQTVGDLADEVGIRAPDEIVLTADAEATVIDRAPLLGLFGGVRRLHLGLPLMAGLTEAQFRAAVAHELGYFSRADTRLIVVVLRSRAQVLRTVAHFEERADKKVTEERSRQERKAVRTLAKRRPGKGVDAGGAGFTYRTTAKIYTMYGRLCVRASLSVSWRQTFAADLVAARIVGRDTTASALREVPVLAAAYAFYMEEYATLGVDVGALPPRGEVFGGVKHVLEARAGELDGMRASPGLEAQSPYDLRPSIAERLARIEALPDDGRADRSARPALRLMMDPAGAFAALEQVVLTPEALGLKRLAWEDLVHESMSHQGALSQSTRDIRAALTAEGTDGTLVGLLDAIDADPSVLWRIADRFPKSERAAVASGRAAREFARPAVRSALGQLATIELTTCGIARWQLSWSGSAYVRYPVGGFEEQLALALDSAVADQPDTEPLRKLVLAS